jgi:hypothetical protein
MNIIWLSPAVLFALGAVAAPVLIHILVQRRAERFPFPTLRFLQPTRLAAIRRHVLEDAALLAVRAAIFAAAVMALAGPLVITAARRQAWDRRVVRAVVVDERAPERGALQETGVARPFQSREFSGTSLRDAVARAVTWLETAPPARRELVIVSPLAIGSSDAADIAAVPASIGIRFERRGDLPPTRTVAAGRLIGSSGMLTREVTLSGAQTSVREAIAQGTQAATSWPIEAVASPAAQPSIDAAVAAVLSGRVWAPRPNQRARLLIVESAAAGAVAHGMDGERRRILSPRRRAAGGRGACAPRIQRRSVLGRAMADRGVRRRRPADRRRCRLPRSCRRRQRRRCGGHRDAAADSIDRKWGR